MKQLLRSIPCLLAISALGVASSAQAHITMTGPLTSRGGDQKSSPCDGAKGDGKVFTFEPGSTITLAVSEDIPHPGYFRIAFDDDGDDGFVEPASIKPIDPNRGCPSSADDQCGESDFCNVTSTTGGATVLWDNLNPHLANAAKAVSWNVKLPDIECENCTLQVLQIMEDDEYHGAYCPQGSCANSAASLEDIYHRCIDITLKRGATNSPGTTTDPVSNMGMECNAGEAGAAGSASPPAAGASGAAGAAAGGSSAPSTAGAAAPAAAGAGGTKAAPTAGAGGAAAPATTTKPATTTPSGSAGTGTTTGSATASGTAGKPATVSGSAGATSSASTGTTTPATTETPATDEGGCAVSNPGSRSGLGSAALLSVVGLLFGARRRQRNRA